MLTLLVVSLALGAALAGRVTMLVAGLVALTALLAGVWRFAVRDIDLGLQFLLYGLLLQFSVGFVAFGLLDETTGGLQTKEEIARNFGLAIPAVLLIGGLAMAIWPARRGGQVQVGGSDGPRES